MATFQNTNISCGVKQLYGFYSGTPLEILRAAWKGWEKTEGEGDPLKSCCHIIFSDETDGPASKFAAYIRENKLGELVESVSRTNPNSKNEITVWVWTPNAAATRRVIKGEPAVVKTAAKKLITKLRGSLRKA